MPRVTESFSLLVIQRLRSRFRILEHSRQSELPLLRFACTRSFRLVHTLLRIHAEDQP